MFEEIYHEYLVHLNEENRKARYDGNEGWYHASGAGLCSRKLYFESVEKAKPTNPPSKKSLRIMGLGTAMHKEIQDSLIYYNNIYYNTKEKEEKPSYKKKSLENLKFHIEGEVRVSSFNVRGFYDVVSQDFSASATEPIVRLHDIKTIGTFQWSKRFSKINPVESGHHYLQLGTYGIGIKEEFGNLDRMGLIYYNKDNSTMRESVVPLTYIDQAKRYWYSINDEHAKGLPSFRLGTSPVHKWVCNYCQFKDHCNPPSTI
jgi:CRISPR/Cas system-associated exonuclease Cas4 (RecB family)